MVPFDLVSDGANVGMEPLDPDATFWQRVKRARLIEPEMSTSQWVAWCIGLVMTCGLFGMAMYFFLTLVVFDKGLNVKPFKGACFDTSDMAEYMCFFSAGQVSYGIIAIGQLSVGMFSLSQCNIGLLFGIGQVACGVGWSFGQLCSGIYIPGCQMGFAAFKCRCAQAGLQVFAPFVHVEGEERLTPGVTCS